MIADVDQSFDEESECDCALCEREILAWMNVCIRIDQSSDGESECDCVVCDSDSGKNAGAVRLSFLSDSCKLSSVLYSVLTSQRRSHASFSIVTKWIWALWQWFKLFSTVVYD